MTAILDINNLSLSRGGKRVLDDISLSVSEGEIVALLGANGAGKSSLVLGTAGMLPLDTGQVRSLGTDLAGKPPYEIRAAGVAAVPEGHQVLTDLSVLENLEVAGAFLTPSETQAGIETAFGIFPELRERRNQKAGSLSGGQQQMLVLGQALVGKPKVILADEMSLGLAPLIVNRLLDVVRSLAKQGTAILLIEQFTHLALGISDRAYVMDRGRVTFSGTPAEVEADPSILHEAYLAAG